MPLIGAAYDSAVAATARGSAIAGAIAMDLHGNFYFVLEVVVLLALARRMTMMCLTSLVARSPE
jgi:hypothetical protein